MGMFGMSPVDIKILMRHSKQLPWQQKFHVHLIYSRRANASSYRTNPPNPSLPTHKDLSL